eukprot:gene9229-11307_t
MVHLHKIAFVTCKEFPQLSEDDEILLKIAKQHWECHVVVWDNDNDKFNWSTFDLVLIRSLWDYVARKKEFLLWVEKLKKLQVKVLNNLDAILWNMNKVYLQQFESAEIETIPSVFIDRRNPENFSLIQYVDIGIQTGKFSVDQAYFVFKPCIGAGGYGAYKFSIENHHQYNDIFKKLLKESDMILQPFVDSIYEQGETSFIFFNGEFSHSIIKKPSCQDFRVQEGYGGTVQTNIPPQSEIQTAKKVIDFIIQKNGPILYARIDMLRYKNRLCLSESEIFEPTLYFMGETGLVMNFITAVNLHLPVRKRACSKSYEQVQVATESTSSPGLGSIGGSNGGGLSEFSAACESLPHNYKDLLIN